LEPALEPAKLERTVLPFVLVSLQDFLERLPRHGDENAAQLRTILDARSLVHRHQSRVRAPRRAGISDAELRVARYLPSNLKAPEIAAELGLSGNTVRTHIRRLYAKLDAHGRTEAVPRARELGLLS
jgi:LuxR family transcriptional regulator, maltose regulon positive regulatory protein